MLAGTYARLEISSIGEVKVLYSRWHCLPCDVRRMPPPFRTVAATGSVFVARLPSSAQVTNENGRPIYICIGRRGTTQSPQTTRKRVRPKRSGNENEPPGRLSNSTCDCVSKQRALVYTLFKLWRRTRRFVDGAGVTKRHEFNVVTWKSETTTASSRPAPLHHLHHKNVINQTLYRETTSTRVFNVKTTPKHREKPPRTQPRCSQIRRKRCRNHPHNYNKNRGNFNDDDFWHFLKRLNTQNTTNFLNVLSTIKIPLTLRWR